MDSYELLTGRRRKISDENGKRVTGVLKDFCARTGIRSFHRGAEYGAGGLSPVDIAIYLPGRETLGFIFEGSEADLELSATIARNLFAKQGYDCRHVTNYNLLNRVVAVISITPKRRQR